MLAAEPADAAELAVLLVRRGGELDRAGERGARALEARQRHGLGRDLVLHVGGAAAPDEPVLDDAAERRHAPLGGVGGHDVEVAHHRECGAGARAVEPRREVLALRQLADQRGLDAVARRGTPAARAHTQSRCRRVGRVDAQQGGEQVDDLALELAPGAVVETILRHAHHPVPWGRGPARRGPAGEGLAATDPRANDSASVLRRANRLGSRAGTSLRHSAGGSA